MRSVIAAVFLLAVCGPAWAQSQGGSVTGTITDRLGGAVAEATVQIAGEGREQTSRTGVDGGYRFHNLAPGEYRLDVFKRGFQQPCWSLPSSRSKGSRTP